MSTTLVLQSSAVLAIALAAAFGLRRRSAALRHFVLASSVVIVIAAAVFARITPTVEIAVRPDVYETIFFPVGGASDSNGVPRWKILGGPIRHRLKTALPRRSKWLLLGAL